MGLVLQLLVVSDRAQVSDPTIQMFLFMELRFPFDAMLQLARRFWRTSGLQARQTFLKRDVPISGDVHCCGMNFHVGDYAYTYELAPTGIGARDAWGGIPEDIKAFKVEPRRPRNRGCS
jgi:hypothetical protein